MAYLMNEVNQRFDLHEVFTNRIGKGKSVDILVNDEKTTNDRHAGIKCVGPAWFLMNLSNDKKSVRHCGHVVTDCVEMAHGDCISICGVKFRFYR